MVTFNHQKYVSSEPYLREHISYDPDTGILTWIKRPNRSRVKVGDIVGTKAKCSHGDMRLVFSVKPYQLMAHRVAWWFGTGEWPKEEIDHINCDSMDNRLCNLRVANRGENCRNKRPYSREKTGLKGAYWNKKDKRWFSQIVSDGRQHYLGKFDSEMEAHLAYCAVAEKMHGNFHRIS